MGTARCAMTAGPRGISFTGEVRAMDRRALGDTTTLCAKGVTDGISVPSRLVLHLGSVDSAGRSHHCRRH
jgi:hypothetical protein